MIKEGGGFPYGLSCGATEPVNIDVLLSSAVFGGIRNTFPLRQKLMWGVSGGKEAGYRKGPENEFSTQISKCNFGEIAAF